MADQKPRQIACATLLERLAARAHTEEVLRKRLENAVLKPADRALCQEIVYGVVRRQRTLDWLIERKAPGRRQAPVVRISLAIGLYQLLWLDRIPSHAAVNESVELARANGQASKSSFVNAVLRRYSAEREGTRARLKSLEQDEPGIGFSHPDWLIRRWQARWGIEKTRQFLEWNNQSAPIFARMNTLRAGPEDTALCWTEEGLEFEPFSRDWLDEKLVYRLQSGPRLQELRSFKKGHFYVQDPSTLLSVRMLSPAPGESVLDFCAAPGGKTTFIAQCLENRGVVIALDPDPGRLALLEDNCVRLGVRCASVLRSDQFSQKHQGRLFDKVLVDAPCSNTGVMRRRVDVRWRLSPDSIVSQSREQLAILQRAADSVKPRGALVYSTCSLEPEENRVLVDEFLSLRPEFDLVSDRELTPMIDGVDGGYAALLRRR